MKKPVVLAGIALFLLGALLVSYMVTRTPPRSRAEKRSEMPRIKQANCFLNARNGSHYIVHLYSRDTLCPATWRYSVATAPGYNVQVYLSNGSKLPPRGTLFLGGNASLIVKASRVNVTVKFAVNAPAPYLVNGSQHRGNLTLTLPWGATLNITPLRLEKGPELLTPINRSLTLNVTGNVTVRLAWEMRCRGVSFRSEPVGVRGLPKCLPVPVTVEFPLEGPAINSTHRYWLAWYWIEENGSKWWWSPGINGSKLRINRPANVTLHYVLGLKELPYVLKVYKWPQAHIKYAGLKVWIEDGWAKAKANLTYMYFYLNGTKYGGHVYYYVLVLEAPSNASLVKVEVYAPGRPGHLFLVPLAWGNFSAGLLVCGKGFLYISNDTRYNISMIDADYKARGYSFLDLWPPYLRLHRATPARLRILVNFTALREAWSKGLCNMPIQKILPGSGIKGTFMESSISGNLNPVKGVYPDTADIVYRWPSGRNLIAVIYYLDLQESRSPAPYIAARIVGVAP